MANILTESSYITVNIKDIINNQTPADNGGTPTALAGGEAPSNPGGTTSENPGAQKPEAQNPGAGQPAPAKKGKIDWAKELQTRLENNRKLSKDARESDTEVENKFWMEFYTTVFGDLAPEVNNIRQLKFDIKKLGFKKKENPILAFLAQAHVKKTFIQPGLINNDRYNVLRLAYGKRYVADSEMLAKNNYNLIYCKDWWSKTPEEMENYLKLQQNILPSNAKVYTPGIQDRNIRIFLPSNCSSMTSGNAKLNSIKEVQRTLNLGRGQFSRDKAVSGSGSTNDENGIKTLDDQPEANGAERPESSKADITAALAKFSTKSPAAGALALQHLALTTGNKSAAGALNSEVFAEVRGKDLFAQTLNVQGILKGLNLKSQEAIDTFVQGIIAKY